MSLFPQSILQYRKCIISCALFILISHVVFAQNQRPIIKATSRKVDVRDGEIYQKGIWNLSPEVKPDIYYVLEPINEKRITFYTDIDSISFTIKPGNSYDFIILLNNKDTCFTQISAIKTVKQIETTTVSLAMIEPKNLQHDFEVFRKALQKDHAGLYRYKNKTGLDKIFDSCLLALNKPMTQLEFAKSIMFVISAIEDGHTRTNIPRLLMNYYRENKKLFPLYPYFVDNKAYVLCGKVGGLPAGTEILSIDNKSIVEIEKEIFNYFPSDGNITTKKRQELNDGAFPIMYGWIFGDKNSFTVRYKNKKGEIGITNLIAKPVRDLECEYKNQSANTKLLQLDFPGESVALLTIKSFDDRRITGVQLGFKTFLDTSFKEINSKKLKNLIIDLRGNGGGTDDYGALFYSYLTSKPFRYFSSKASTSRMVKPDENPLLGIQNFQENNFQGKVLILINGLSFSTTADFCAIVKSNGRALFIGEETGGGYYGNTSGGSTNEKLPNSNIDIIIPQFKYVNAVKKAKYKDRGTIPDFVILPSIDDILLHRDIQLNLALKLVNGK